MGKKQDICYLGWPGKFKKNALENDIAAKHIALFNHGFEFERFLNIFSSLTLWFPLFNGISINKTPQMLSTRHKNKVDLEVY